MRLLTFILCFTFTAACTHSASGPSDTTQTDREVVDSLVNDNNLEHWIAVKSTVKSYEVMYSPTASEVLDSVMVAPLIRMVETSTSARVHIDTVDMI